MLVGALPDAVAATEAVVLLDSRSHALSVITGPKATPRTVSAADTLASYLSQMTGHSFPRATGHGTSGIVVGTIQDFDVAPLDVAFESGPFHREEYVLRSGRNGLWLIGATELAAEHAVWDCLYRFGHRQYFPWETWEVTPQLEAPLKLTIDVREQPDFLARRIWYNWGHGWQLNVKPYQQWCAANRAVRGFVVDSGHAYEAIIGENRAEFEAHPEYGALIDGKRQFTKFCTSNPGLRKLVIEDAKRRAKRGVGSISMDPSDGGV